MNGQTREVLWGGAAATAVAFLVLLFFETRRPLRRQRESKPRRVARNLTAGGIALGRRHDPADPLSRPGGQVGRAEAFRTVEPGATLPARPDRARHRAARLHPLGLAPHQPRRSLLLALPPRAPRGPRHGRLDRLPVPLRRAGALGRLPNRPDRPPRHRSRLSLDLAGTPGRLGRVSSLQHPAAGGASSARSSRSS